MKTLRSVLGVILGYLVGAAAGLGVVAWLFGGQADPGAGPVIAGLAVLVAVLVLAGFLAGTVAGRRQVLHAGIVAGLSALVIVASLANGAAVEPAWYRVLLLVLGSGAILLGGRLATSIQLRK